MFNLGAKREKDPKKALGQAEVAVNKGLSGALVKGLMGKDFVDEVNSALDMGAQAVEGMERGQWLSQNGLEAEAEVLSVADTRQTINMNPVVRMHLNVTSAVGTQFDTSGQCMVSRIAAPRVGDTIKIRYNPGNPGQFTVM